METLLRNRAPFLFILMIAAISAGATPARQSPAQLKEIIDSLGEASGPSAQAKRAAIKKTAQDLGMAEYQSGRYSEALSYFEVAVLIAKDGETEFIQGMTLVRLARLEEARAPFQSASTTANSPTVRAAALDYLRKLDSPGHSDRFWGNLEIGAGYNTNVGLESTTTANPVASATTQTTLLAGWAWLSSEKASGALAYQAFWEEPLSASSGRFISQTIRPSLGYSLDDWYFRLAPAFQYQIYGASPFLIRYFLGAQAQRFFRPYLFGLQADVGKSVAQGGDYRYLDGTFHTVRIIAGYRSSPLDIQIAYSYTKDDLGDRTEGVYLLPIKNTSHGPSVRLIWEPGPRWELIGSLGYLMRDYPTLGLPGNHKRNDNQISGYVRASHQISPTLSLFCSGQWLVNQSSLNATSGIEDKNYTQVMGIGGVSWDIIN